MPLNSYVEQGNAKRTNEKKKYLEKQICRKSFAHHLALSYTPHDSENESKTTAKLNKTRFIWNCNSHMFQTETKILNDPFTFRQFMLSRIICIETFEFSSENKHNSSFCVRRWCYHWTFSNMSTGNIMYVISKSTNTGRHTHTHTAKILSSFNLMFTIFSLLSSPISLCSHSNASLFFHRSTISLTEWINERNVLWLASFHSIFHPFVFS